MKKLKAKKVFIEYWVKGDCSLISNSMKLNKRVGHLRSQFNEFHGEAVIIEVEVDDKLYQGYFKKIVYKGVEYSSTIKFMRMICSMYKIFGADFEKQVFGNK